MTPSPEPSPHAHAALNALRQRFRAGLPARLAEIEQDTDAQLRLLAAHRLAGAASSYGYTELAQAARHCEQGLEQQAGDMPQRLQTLRLSVQHCMYTV